MSCTGQIDLTLTPSVSVQRRKPRLAFFQCRYGPAVPRFALIHNQEHIKCLSQFFDVTVISKDCDYQAVCDRFEPELCVFELGLQLPGARRASISNTGANPGLPRIGLMNADAWGATCATVLSDVDHFGLDALFSICTTTAEHLPSIADMLYVIPNFIDPEIYGQVSAEKLIPVVMSGSCDPQYPWRHNVYRRLASAPFATALLPHHGYRRSGAQNRMLMGRQYAQAIAAAWFAPTCGTVANELLRKHLEIPACRTCLVTESSPVLVAAGFVDMVNCVFADDRDIIAKIEHLLSNPLLLHEIIEAGHRLTMSRHTLAQRDQIHRWFELRKERPASSTKIVQDGPFGSLESVSADSERRTRHLRSGALHLHLLAEGDRHVSAGDCEAARDCYRQALSYAGSMHQARLKSALCDLLSGDPSAALDSIVPLLKETLLSYRDVTPDPVEWAYFIVCLLCQGRLREAARRARQFRTVRHPELDLIRSLVDSNSKICPDDRAIGRTSLHASTSRDAWFRQLRQVLFTCGQRRMVARLGLETGASREAAVLPLRAPDLRRIAGALGRPALCGLDHPFPLRAIRSRWDRAVSKLAQPLRRMDKRAAGQDFRAIHPNHAKFLERLRAMQPKSILLLYPPDHAQVMTLLDAIADAAPNAMVICVFDGDPERSSGGDVARARGHMIVRCDTRSRPSGPSGKPWLREVLSLSGGVDFDAVLMYCIPDNLNLADLEYIQSLLDCARIVAFGEAVDLHSLRLTVRPVDGSPCDVVPRQLFPAAALSATVSCVGAPSDPLSS